MNDRQIVPGAKSRGGRPAEVPAEAVKAAWEAVRAARGKPTVPPDAVHRQLGNKGGWGRVARITASLNAKALADDGEKEPSKDLEGSNEDYTLAATPASSTGCSTWGGSSSDEDYTLAAAPEDGKPAGPAPAADVGNDDAPVRGSGPGGGSSPSASVSLSASLFLAMAIACVVFGALCVLAGYMAARTAPAVVPAASTARVGSQDVVEQPSEAEAKALTASLAKMGLDATSIFALGNGFYEASLEFPADATGKVRTSKAVFRADAGTITLGGLRDRATGEAILDDIAIGRGAVSPAIVVSASSVAHSLSLALAGRGTAGTAVEEAPIFSCQERMRRKMAEHAQGAGAGAVSGNDAGNAVSASGAGIFDASADGAKPVATTVTPSPAGMPPQRNVKAGSRTTELLAKDDMPTLQAAPAKLPHPDMPPADAPIVILLWSGCPDCRIVERRFDGNREKAPFRTAFVPIAGTPDPEAVAPAEPGMTQVYGDAGKELAARLDAAMRILAEVAGTVRGPAGACAAVDGSQHVDAGTEGANRTNPLARLDGRKAERRGIAVGDVETGTVATDAGAKAGLNARASSAPRAGAGMSGDPGGNAWKKPGKAVHGKRRIVRSGGGPAKVEGGPAKIPGGPAKVAGAVKIRDGAGAGVAGDAGKAPARGNGRRGVPGVRGGGDGRAGRIGTVADHGHASGHGGCRRRPRPGTEAAPRGGTDVDGGRRAATAPTGENLQGNPRRVADAVSPCAGRPLAAGVDSRDVPRPPRLRPGGAALLPDDGRPGFRRCGRPVLLVVCLMDGLPHG